MKLKLFLKTLFYHILSLIIITWWFVVYAISFPSSTPTWETPWWIFQANFNKIFDAITISSTNNNVGINKTNPTHKLDVVGWIYSDGTTYGVYWDGTSYGVYWKNSDSNAFGILWINNYWVYSKGNGNSGLYSIDGDSNSVTLLNYNNYWVYTISPTYTTDYSRADGGMRAPKYCDENGNNCFNAATVSWNWGILKKLTYTSSSTFTVPTWVEEVFVTIVGGWGWGGGGARWCGSVPSGNRGGWGGWSAGARIMQLVKVNSGENINITLGAGWTAGSINGWDWGNGGSSSFGSYVSVIWGGWGNGGSDTGDGQGWPGLSNGWDWQHGVGLQGWFSNSFVGGLGGSTYLWRGWGGWGWASELALWWVGGNWQFTNGWVGVKGSGGWGWGAWYSDLCPEGKKGWAGWNGYAEVIRYE